MIPTRLTLALCLWLSGCSTAATLSLNSGVEVEARIRGADQDNLIVMTKDGSEVAIPREEISEIDHPGNVAAVIGGLMTANVTQSVVRNQGFTCGESEQPEATCLGVGIHAAIGAYLLLWGLVTWVDSTRAAASPVSQGSGEVQAPLPSAFDFSPARVGGSSRLPD